MKLRPSVFFAVLFFLLACILAVIAYDRNNTLDSQRAQFASERTEIALQMQAVADNATQAAATHAAQETQAAEALAGVRSAASTLQAGALATRAGLLSALDDADATIVQGDANAATLAADAQAAERTFAAASTAQAEQLASAQTAIAAAATQALGTAASVATQQAAGATLEADLAAAQTQVAVLAANPPTPPPDTSATPGLAEARPIAEVAAGQLLYVDNFDDDSLPPLEIAQAGTGRIEDGQLVLTTIEQPQREMTLLTQGTITDALIEIEIKVESCSERSLLLLEVRDDTNGSNGYAIGVNCAYNIWGVFKRAEEQIERLTTQAISLTDIDPGAAHVLSVEARGATFTLYLDGQRLGSVNDDTYAEGIIGFTLVADSAAIVRLDNLRAWALAAPAADATATPQTADSRVARDAFLARLPATIAAGDRRWRVQGEPSLDLDGPELASAAMRINDIDTDVRAGIIVIYSIDTQTLGAIIDSAEAELQIERFDDSPADFPEPNIFGTGRDGLDAWWVQDSAVVRVTIIDTDNATEADLLALARAIRDIVVSD
ncbi:MAG: hypothetical protein KJ065_09060 [Anaerolineae bacterium]|nr:hypothetical protein [Anaerolineae bacterium]